MALSPIRVLASYDHNLYPSPLFALMSRIMTLAIPYDDYLTYTCKVFCLYPMHDYILILFVRIPSPTSVIGVDAVRLS
jgi:hypothetical protein